jgi:cell division protein FtsB
MDERRQRSDDRVGHLTTTIHRPSNRRASDAGRSRLVDNRRRKIAARPPVPRVSTTWLFGLAALVIAGAIVAALFGLPVRTWFDQDSELQALEHELTEMQSVNHDLQGEVDRLRTDDGIREAARAELGLIQAGDKRLTMLDLPPLPTDLPAGWPYSQIAAILDVRAALVTPSSSEPAASASTLAPPTTAIPPSTTVATPTTTAATPTSAAPTTVATPTTAAVTPTTAAAPTTTTVP